MTTQSTKDRCDRVSWIVPASRALAVAAVVALTVLSLSDAWALKRIVIGGPFVPGGGQPTTETSDDDDGPFPNGPTLTTDTDVDRLLRRAHEYIADGRFDLATLAMQQALDDQYQVARREGRRDGDDERAMALMKLPDDQWKPVIDAFHPTAALDSKDERRPFQPYRSVAYEVERLIRKLPPGGMRVYRLTADGKAQGLLEKARSGDAKEALAELVWKYFNSSYGDEAAFQLGCLLMERRDFVAANRYFEKVLNDHPDPTVPREQVLLRLAVINARLGDDDAAARILGQLAGSGRGSVSPLAMRLVTEDVTRHKGSASAALAAAKAWPMRLGSPARNGVMPGPGLSAKTSHMQLHDTWRDNKPFKLTPPDASAVANAQGQSSPAPRSRLRDPTQRPLHRSVGVEQLVNDWRSSKWTPTSSMLLDGDLIYLKSFHYPPDKSDKDESNQSPRVLLMGYNAATGRRAWEHSWFDDNLDAATAYPGNSAAGTTSSGKPRNMKEMAIFGDHISHAISVIDGIVYSLEGFPDAQTTRDRFRGGSTVKYGVTTNRLAAFEPRGKTGADGIAIMHEGGLRWHRGGDRDPETGQEVPVVFCAAPVPFGPRLIVPVRDAGSLWLYAIEPKQNDDGSWEKPTIWKTLLCDEPPGGVNPFATVGIAVRGSDVYVGSGAGVVFAVDGATGVIRWATRYKRTGVSGVTGVNQFRQITRSTNIEGFDVDTVIPFEGKLVVLPSDSRHIFTVDRRSGEPVNYAPGSSDCKHVLGTAGRWLILGGPNRILCFDMKTGSLPWQWPREEAVAILGRGCVTTEGAFVPVDDTVVQLSLPKLEFLGSRHVAQAGNAPLGNLYSNGERLFALGIERVLALGSIEQLIVQLDKEVDKPVDPERDVPAQQAAQLAARSERMRLQAKLNNTDAAIADLKVLVAAADAQRPGKAAGLKLLVVKIGELDLAAKAGLDSFELLMNAPGDLSDWPDGRQQRLAIFEKALRGIGKNEEADAKQHERAISLVLRLIARDPQRHLLDSAQKALKSALRPEDAGVLKKALASGSVSLRVSAIVPLLSLEGAKAADAIAAVLADKIARVRIEAAHGLAEVGDRRALGAFVDLLSSDDVILRGQALSALRSVSDQQFGLRAGAKPEARTAAIEKWRQWVEKEGDKAKLDRSRKAISVDLGRLLVAIRSRVGLKEFDSEGTQTFSADDVLVASACQGLPGGQRLVASRDSMIFKYPNGDGPIWSATVPGSPVSIKQLRNEHILVACVSRVVEVDPNRNVIPVPTPKGTFYDARRVGEGLTLLAMIADGKGLVVEVDREGRVVREIAKAIKPVAARRLPNGNTLVVDEEAADDGPQVVEYDGQGKIVWQQSGLLSPHDAQRLPNGNTLVVDNNGIKEFDPAGKVVWKKDEKMVRSAYRY